MLHNDDKINRADQSPSIHPSHVNKDTPIIDKHEHLGDYSNIVNFTTEECVV